MHSINIGIWFAGIVYTFSACNVITTPKKIMRKKLQRTESGLLYKGHKRDHKKTHLAHQIPAENMTNPDLVIFVIPPPSIITLTNLLVISNQIPFLFYHL